MQPFMTHTTFPILPGEKLPNGATLIDSREHEFGDYVVFASWRDEYVTWHSDESGNTYWGHYFPLTDVDSAAKDFVNR